MMMMNQEVKYRYEEGEHEDLSSTSSTTRRTTTSTSLDVIVVAFEEVAELLNSGNNTELRLDTFCESCSLVSVLFSCLGIAFKFAEMEYVAKVQNLVQASKTYETLQEILDRDIANGNVKTQGSNSRNLRRVRQGLDLIRALFQQFLATNDESLKEAASTAYAQVCAPYHSWTVRTAVYAGMCALPSRVQLLQRLNETDKSAEEKMKKYIDASLPVIQYIDNLYISRNIKLDW